MKSLWKVGLVVLFSAVTAAAAEKEPTSAYFQAERTEGQRGSLADCSGFDSIQQPLDSANFNTARTSDEQAIQQVWAGVIAATDDTVSATRVWGLSIEFDPGAGFIAECSNDNNTPFNIYYHDDNAGSPGNVLGSEIGVPVLSVVDTGIAFAFTTIFEYELDASQFTDSNLAWISIERQTGLQAGSGNDCYWLWVDETLAGSYDDQAFSLANGPEPTDQAFCVAGDLPVTLTDFTVE